MLLPPSACNIASFFVGIVEVCYMSAPVGDCIHCCPRDDKIDIQYKLFTRQNPKEYQIIPLGNDTALRATNFNASNPTVIYIMGFSESVNGVSTTTLRDAHLLAGNYNFISVDWTRLAAFPWYISAVRNTQYMGVRLADFIQFLDRSGIPASSLHVIGFSLGAEVAGFCGKDLKRRGLRIGRITGLDPAFPGYSLRNSSDHLAKGDAAFVDVVHTNPGVFGFPLAIGDVDFYPNAGTWVQPGCWVSELIKNKQLRYIYGCSHNRAWRFYAESMSNPLGFPATLCKNWKSPKRYCNFTVDGYLGIKAAPPMAGKMYLETNSRPPFAKNGP